MELTRHSSLFIFSLASNGFWHWKFLWMWNSLGSGLFVEEIIASIKDFRLFWQHGLTHDGFTPAFIARDGLDHVPPFMVLLVLRSLSSLSWCLWLAFLMPAFSIARAVLYVSLSPDQKAASLADTAISHPSIQALLLGNDFIIFVVTTSSTGLLMHDVSDDVHSSRLMCFS